MRVSGGMAGMEGVEGVEGGEGGAKGQLFAPRCDDKEEGEWQRLSTPCLCQGMQAPGGESCLHILSLFFFYFHCSFYHLYTV